MMVAGRFDSCHGRQSATGRRMLGRVPRTKGSRQMNTYETLADLTAEDMLDSRDLEDILTSLEDATDPWSEATHIRTALLALKKETADYAGDDWADGIGFIRDSYFRDYAMELAEDIGAVNPDATWPNNCIDWERAARELQIDYTATEIVKVTYWYR